jgi:sigma-B regulation protein RsbU (phosphoserine phosphatase)
MFKKRSLVFKLVIFISGSAALIFIAIFFFNYNFSKKMIRKHVEENAQNFALRIVNKIESVLYGVEDVPDNIAFLLKHEDLDRGKVLELLQMAVLNNAEIFGAGIAFEPYAFDKNSLYWAPYYNKEKHGLVLDWIGIDDSDRYFHDDWYQIPRELNKPYWSEPYFDQILMTTYSVPFYENTPDGRKIKGIICADISLEWLTKIVSSIKVLDTGDAYLISKNGAILTHNVKDLIMNESIFGVAEERNDKALREIGRKMIKGESGLVSFKSIARGKKSLMYYVPVPSTGWTLAVLFPEDEFLADIRKLNQRVALLGCTGMLLLVGVIMAISRSITKPLSMMAVVAQEIGTGDLDAVVPSIKTGDEVGKLADAFRYMQVALKDYIKRLTAATAAKERIESELKIAHEIQTSMLPRIFPAFPSRKEFDIFATMEPAKEVGGDLYDFFLINDRKLCFIMGDVSGKGVPAALFMMITKTLLKNAALQDLSADEVLFRTNNIIALDNESAMFATVFCGILDTQTGEVEFSNAGHNPPLVCRKAGGYEYIDVGSSFVLGPMPNFKFILKKIQLAPGDTLFLYTDGVTEAMNNKKELFSEDKLKIALTALKDNKTVDIVSALRHEISVFVKDEPQSDDITMLALRFQGLTQDKKS